MKLLGLVPPGTGEGSIEDKTGSQVILVDQALPVVEDFSARGIRLLCRQKACVSMSGEESNGSRQDRSAYTIPVWIKI
jgi:hypothetical protein